jgi:hypothetical protein
MSQLSLAAVAATVARAAFRPLGPLLDSRGLSKETIS